MEENGTPEDVRREKVRARNVAFYAKNAEREKERAQAYRAANPDKSKSSYAKWIAKPGSRMYRAVSNARKRARDKGLPFTLDDRWRMEAELASVCPVLGLPYDYGKASSRQNPLAPSIDQIIPGLGYTPSNVRVTSWWANMAKGQLSEEQFRQFILAAAAVINGQGSSSPEVAPSNSPPTRLLH